MKKINLALQGGGSHGAFTWGILDKILEDGRLDIDNICSTSAGTVNSVVLTAGKIKNGNEGARTALHDFWQDVSKINGKYYNQPTPFINNLINRLQYSIADMMSHVISPYQFNPFNINTLKYLLEKHINFKELKDKAPHKLYISATNVTNGKIKIFDNNDLSVETVLASACLPNIFQAVKVKDDYYWDGGYTGNPTLWPLFHNEYSTNDIIIIHINPIIRDKIPKTACEIINRTNEISFNSSLLNELRGVELINRILKEGWLKDEFKDQLQYVHLHSIRADKALLKFDVSTKSETDWNFLKKLRDIGRNEASIWLDKNFDHIGKRSTIDLKEV